MIFCCDMSPYEGRFINLSYVLSRCEQISSVHTHATDLGIKERGTVLQSVRNANQSYVLLQDLALSLNHGNKC